MKFKHIQEAQLATARTLERMLSVFFEEKTFNEAQHEMPKFNYHLQYLQDVMDDDPQAIDDHKFYKLRDEYDAYFSKPRGKNKFLFDWVVYLPGWEDVYDNVEPDSFAFIGPPATFEDFTEEKIPQVMEKVEIYRKPKRVF